VSGEVVLVTATAEADFAAYKGKLKGKWVLTQAAPDVAAYWKPQATRHTAEELAALEAWPAPQPEFGVTPPGGRAGGPGAPAPAGPPAGGRGAMGAMAARAAFFKAEGVLGTFTTAPRGHGIYTVGGNRAADPAATLPAVAIAAEHYGPNPAGLQHRRRSPGHGQGRRDRHARRPLRHVARGNRRGRQRRRRGGHDGSDAHPQDVWREIAPDGAHRTLGR
jgi:hypothetical protein